MVLSSTLLLCAAAPAVMALSVGKRQAAGAYSLPSSSANSTARAAALSVKRAGWEYGPFLDTAAPFYPKGELGDAVTFQVRHDWNTTQQDPQSAKSSADAQANMVSIVSTGGLTTLEDYNKLYDNSWTNSAPNGPWKGMLQNYTSDLLFGMERLSTSPYSVKRLQPTDSLPFTVDNAASISGQSLEALLAGNRLFLVDYSSFKDLPLSAGKYAAACQAYFYIHPQSGDFLPLAIKTNVGSDLTYTPEDSENDWLLAKMLFNINDGFNQEFEHFAASHWVAEIAYLAAIRTLSEEHPIMPIVHRLMKLAWAMRPAAAERLLFAGGPVERLYPWTGGLALKYATDLYLSGVSGSFTGGYFETDLEKRGLLGKDGVPKFKTFPYYEDASVIVSSIQGFMSTLVDSYYSDDKEIQQDIELQAWISEATEAEIIDFPASPLGTKKDLVKLLTHIAYLVSVKHGVSNTNSVVATLSLPFHPFALWAPLPTEKGVTNVVPFLPGVEASVGQLLLEVSFNRPTWVNSDENIIHMFADSDVLSKMDTKVQGAATKFASEMTAFSGKVSSRTFDKDGLSQGMPFVWQALDPNQAGYWLAV
ncbi:hypothetical protein V2G26_002691 [Clonostachys chloroleuca]